MTYLSLLSITYKRITSQEKPFETEFFY